MSVGKYSPTVVAAYAMNQKWWKPASSNNFYDAEGFDSYGYDKTDHDRAGIAERDYTIGEWFSSTHAHILFDNIAAQWTTDKNGQPLRKS